MEILADFKHFYLEFLRVALFTADMWTDLENKIVSYADDTTLYGNVNSPEDRAAVANSLNRDLLKIQSRCVLTDIS